MNIFDKTDHTFVCRDTMICGDVEGVIAIIPLDVWRHRDGEFVLVPDDPAHACYIEEYMSLRESQGL